LQNRVELGAIALGVDSIRQTKKVLQAGYLPHVDA
jgi:hypothetical protein